MMHKARKRFGQNFLVDEQIIADIIRAIRPEFTDHMVEIGPGLGALTRPLIKNLTQLHVVEIDRDIIERLENDYPKEKLIIHAGDALKFDLAQLPIPLRVVGNLPYNISSPLLFYFAEYADRIIDMHFMLQNEVVERMVAAPSTPAYGRLSVMLQYPQNPFVPHPKLILQLCVLFHYPPAKFRCVIRYSLQKLLPQLSGNVVKHYVTHYAAI